MLVYEWDVELGSWVVAAPAMPQSLWTLRDIAPDAELLVRVDSSTPIQYVSERPLTLGPNTRYAGWVAKPTTTQELFNALPEVDSVHAWNASGRYWMSASRTDPGGLITIYPGMGLRLQRNGEPSTVWERPLTPERGLVELHAGDNLVAWAGANGAIIEEVVKGIGKSFEQARMWNAAEQRFHVYPAVDADAADPFPPVMLGDAIWITVSRRTNWLQPTGVLPELIFAGNVSQKTRNDATRDLEDTLAYVAEVFGVQADPSISVGLVAADAHSFFDALVSLGREWEWEAARNWYEQAGGFGGRELFFVKAAFWETDGDSRYTWARQVILEEYFHGLQRQLAGEFGRQRPAWLVEGSAAWIRADLRMRDQSGQTLSQELSNIRKLALHGPTLGEIEEPNQLWQYSFGLIAADLLVQRAGAPALLDFFRALVPGRTGTKGQWASQLSWEAAFATTFGISVEDFYAEFDTHIQEYQGNGPRSARGGEIKLTGTVVDGSGLPLEGIWLRAIEFVNEQRTPYGFAVAKANDNGEFSLFVNERADYRIQVGLSDHFACQYWWTSDGDSVASLEENAELIKVGTNAPAPLTIVVNSSKCRWGLDGVLYGPDEEPLAGIQVQARNGEQTTSAWTDLSGSFELAVLATGAHELFINLGSCLVFYRPGSATTNREELLPIAVSENDVSGIRFQLRQDHCTTKITGHVLDTDGTGISDVWVYASDEDSSTPYARTDGAGAFSITIPNADVYRLEVSIDGCRVYFRRGGAVASHEQATRITIDDRNVTGVRFQLRQGQCTTKISGRLLDAGGHPIAETRVYAWPEDGTQSSTQTDSEGSFVITLPEAGQFRVYARVDGCTVYYRSGGATGSYQQATQVRVSDSDVTGITLQLAQGMCEHRISGILSDADGTPLSGQWVSANGDAGSAGAWTSADGSFSFAVPASGSYRLDVWFDGCSIYRGSRGPVRDWNSASQVRVSNADVTGIEFRLPEDPSTFCN